MPAPMKPMFFAKKKANAGEIYIYQEIGEGWYGGVSANSFADALKEVGNVDDLDIYINSPGGSVFEGVAIYNQLARFKAKKVVHIDALAASIASVIAMAGDEIRIASNAMIMIHRPWGVCVGTAEDMRRNAETMDQVHDTILDTYVARTKGDRSKIDDWMKEETWMRAQEAVDRGFADSIETGGNVAAQDSAGGPARSSNVIAFPLLAKFKNTPRDLVEQARDSKVLVARMAMHSQKYSRLSPAKT
jgi:ATP-dependent Clp protease, protease subunit